MASTMIKGNVQRYTGITNQGGIHVSTISLSRRRNRSTGPYCPDLEPRFGLRRPPREETWISDRGVQEALDGRPGSIRAGSRRHSQAVLLTPRP